MVIPACRVSMASPTAPGKRLGACGRQNNSTLPRGHLCGRSGGARRLHPWSATAKRLSLSLSSTHWIPCSSKQTGKIQFSIWYFKKCNLQIAFSFSWKTKGCVCVCVCVCVSVKTMTETWGGVEPAKGMMDLGSEHRDSQPSCVTGNVLLCVSEMMFLWAFCL